MDLPALDLEQEIGEFEGLVLIEKKDWKKRLANSSVRMQHLTFLEDIPIAEDLQLTQQTDRIIYVIIQCIPIPILLKTTNSRSLIIPISIDQRDPVKNLFKLINAYFQASLEQRGLTTWKNSTKLILSEQNHQFF